MDAKKKYDLEWEALVREPGSFNVFREPVSEPFDHPENFIDFECAFAARQIRRAAPEKILEVGSYRHFVLGLQANYAVTTVDVRPRKMVGERETLVTCDAKKIPLPDQSFDLVLSLCALEHFGLGRYGDDFDLDADRKAMREMTCLLKPGGCLVFTTTITRSLPSIAFNAHRIYNLAMLKDFCAGLHLVEEEFYSHEKKDRCLLQEVTDKPRWWDVYAGCWKK